ncbi:hypothetical protein [Mucilaginibacter kameinonensis]|uniref:hypothetical protein n=1 Tax=Mucilaginibacter kameinonensis TaxID=452286 RepID=UPI000EF7E449|nr:hypothetical protein [Mucilaginibacter kameinonensis]
MKDKNIPWPQAAALAILVLLLWGGMQWLSRRQLSAGLKDLLGISFIIWFAIILLRGDSGDDWAGQM